MASKEDLAKAFKSHRLWRKHITPGADQAGASFTHSMTESRNPCIPSTGSISYETGNRHYLCNQ